MKTSLLFAFLGALCTLSTGQQFGSCHKCTRSKVVSYRYPVYYRRYWSYTVSHQCSRSWRSCHKKWGITYCTTRYGYQSCYDRRTSNTVETSYRTGYRRYTWSYCCQKEITTPLMNGTLRLVNGTAPYNGRLEVNYKGRFGTICDDGFDTIDGNVACHQLGFTGVSQVRQGAYYGEGRGNIWLESIGCQSNDVHMANCSHRGWGIEDCHHGEDIGLECNKVLNIHLNGGRTPFKGRVVVYQGGSWGNICDRNWDINDAKVVCNQLGYGNAIKAIRGGVFTPGTSTLMMSNVDCVGHETAISFCTHNGWRNVGSCTHANDAGVACSGPSPTITASIITATSVTILVKTLPQLQYVLGLNINSYKVHCNIADVNTVTIHTVQARDHITIDNLVPRRTYEFKVALVAASTIGPYSNPITVTTKQAVPEAINSFSGYPIATNSSIIYLSWNPPTVTNGNLHLYLEYKYYLTTGRTPVSFVQSVDISSSITSYELTELDPDTLYTMTLYAENEVGRSEGVSIEVKTYAIANECD